MDRIEVSTVVHLPPEEVYEFLVDFPGYANYSEYLERVRSDGDGSPGTRYALRFSWWRITYTAHTKVTGADPPNRIDWEVIKDMNARGHWRIEEGPDLAPEGVETACRVTLQVEFEPGSVKVGQIGLPSFVSLSWLVEKVTPLVQEEAERVVERIVEDIEGESRPVELTVHAMPDSL